MKLASALRVGTAAALAVSTLTTVTALALAAAPSAEAASLAPCPISALTKAAGPVTITFWNSMVQANATTLASITNAFNSSQSKVHVTLVTQPDYDSTWNDYVAGLSNGQLPDVVQLEDQRTQEAIDTQSFLPVQSCINATHYATSDFLTRALDYWKVNGTQEAMPFAVSNPVVYYNEQSFTKAGLTPGQPPPTLADYLADAKALKATGTGTGLVLDPWHLETWLATANTLFVNHSNGRSGRATKGAFDVATARTIFGDLQQLVTSGDAVTNPASGPDSVDNLLGIGAGKYGMTIDTSADLGTITQVLASGAYPNVTLGVGPFPVVSTKVHGGIEPGGSGVYISDKVPAIDQAAAWEYVSYLDSTQSMATWAAGTGYIPIRKSSVTTPTIENLWASDPGYKVAYDQLLNGANDVATSGAVIGPYEDVRADILSAEESMYTGGVSPTKALANAEAAVNATISSYNGRLGVS
jgi:sn-glycerol 3-phosphate transport system substrate-binding protein